MSYDLAVFDAAVAPDSARAFIGWYREQVSWERGQRYDDPARTTEGLRRWFFDMLATYPAMNGPHAKRTEGEASRVADYSIGPHLIYVAFPWSQADVAAAIVRGLAEKHLIGFYDVSSSDGGVWLPSSSRDPRSARYRRALRTAP